VCDGICEVLAAKRSIAARRNLRKENANMQRTPLHQAQPLPPDATATVGGTAVNSDGTAAAALAGAGLRPRRAAGRTTVKTPPSFCSRDTSSVPPPKSYTCKTPASVCPRHPSHRARTRARTRARAHAHAEGAREDWQAAVTPEDTWHRSERSDDSKSKEGPHGIMRSGPRDGLE
jgi:hypothetical protein